MRPLEVKKPMFANERYGLMHDGLKQTLGGRGEVFKGPSLSAGAPNQDKRISLIYGNANTQIRGLREHACLPQLLEIRCRRTVLTMLAPTLLKTLSSISPTLIRTNIIVRVVGIETVLKVVRLTGITAKTVIIVINNGSSCRVKAILVSSLGLQNTKTLYLKLQYHSFFLGTR